MNKGDILHSSNHDFDSDSKPSDKFLILLNNPHENNTYVLVFVNSNDVWRNRTSGCHNQIRDAHFVIDKGQDWFDQDKTFIIFRYVRVLTQREFQDQQGRGNLKKVASLRAPMLRAIINCYKGTMDISGFVRELI